MSRQIGFLNDPYVVARVQKYLGIELIKLETNNESLDQHSMKNVHHINMLDNKKCLYKINNTFFYWFFMFITHLGNEVFYILFLPMLMWNFDDNLAFLTTISWAFSMYFGQASKDLIKMARPATPPVVKLEVKYLLEYGFPSTHAMAALTISITLLTLLFEKYDQAEHFYFRSICLGMAVLICFLVCLSRVYLGMHSCLDIIGGLMFSLFLSLVFLKLLHGFKVFVEASFLNGCVVYMLALFLCLIYPGKSRWTSARSDAFLILGVAGGLTIGMSLKHSLKLHDIGKLNPVAGRNPYINWIILARIAVGVTTVLLSRVLTKQFLYNLIAWLSGGTKNVKELFKQNFWFDVFFYYFCYTSVSFTVTFTSFFLFDYLKIN